MKGLIEIAKENESVIETVISEKFTKREQLIYINKGLKYPEGSKVSLQDGQPAYRAGFYNICPTSYKSDQYGGLTLDSRNLKLIKVT